MIHRQLDPPIHECGAGPRSTVYYSYHRAVGGLGGGEW